MISFPIYGLLLHIFFYKIFGIFSIIVLEFILHLIFLVIFFKAINKIFNDFKNTLLFCFLIYFLISFLNIILFDENIKYLKLFYESLEQNFTTRLPRPLFTGIIYFYFFFLLYEFKNKLKKIELKYFIIIFFLLSVFLNSFFYYFLNFSLLIFLLLIKFLRKNLLKFLYENRSKILILISFFLISSVPFLIQIYFGENDYSQRIGVFEITLEKKIYLLKYYFLNLFKKEFFILILLSFIIHLYLIKNSLNIKSQINKLNIYYYFIIASIIVPPIFFLLSPKLVSIYHFLGITIFGIIFYLFLSIYFILSQKLVLIIKTLNINIIRILLLVIFFLNTYSAKLFFNKNINQINGTTQIQEFIISNSLTNSNKKLFTNDLNIMNLWLLNENNQLVISDGFTNSLKNDQIEFNLINSLKDFEISELEFKKFISFKKSKKRDGFFMTLFNYRYQANSLYTFSDIDEYTNNTRSDLFKTSPFRVQSQIIPEDEKRRLIELFRNLNINQELLPDVVILNKSDLFSSLEIKNKKYKLFYSSNIYDIYLSI